MVRIGILEMPPSPQLRIRGRSWARRRRFPVVDVGESRSRRLSVAHPRGSSPIAGHSQEKLPHDPLAALYGRGARFVLADQHKAAGRGWHQRMPDLAEVAAHAAGVGLIGIVPASVRCMVVDVDIDVGGWRLPEIGELGVRFAVDALGEPIARVRTPSGGWHLWYWSSESPGNRQWPSGTSAAARAT